MKFLLYTLLSFAGFLAIGMGFVFLSSKLSESNLGGTVIAVFQGGTGTTTAPTSQVLYGGSSGVYQSVATGTVSTGNTALSVTASRYILGGDLTLTVATTTTNMYSGTPGQVLSFANGGWFGVGTTTFSGGLTYSSGNVTCTACGSGSSNAVATTSDIAVPQVAYFTRTGGVTTFGSAATGTISSGSGISIDSATRYIIGGSLAITNTSPSNWATSTVDALAIYPAGGLRVGIGTTTPKWGLQLASTTGPQLALSDDIDQNHWTFRSAGGLLYLATSSPTNWATSTTPHLTLSGSNGSTGVGSSTPWGVFSIQQDSLASNNGRPLVAIATSTRTGVGAWIWGAFSTTTIQRSVSVALSLVQDIGARIGIGTYSQYGFGGILDQLFVHGRINTGDWIARHCPTLYPTVASVAADTGNMPCPGWSFMIDNAGSIATQSRAVAGETYSGVVSATSPANAGNNGAGVFYAPVGASNNLKFSTSTPVMEGTIAIRPYSASTTSFYFGFSNLNTAGTAFETFPTAGCFFNASSTAQTGNWYAVSNVVAGAGSPTYVNTGIASSSGINMASGSAGNFYRLRIEADSLACRFYIQPPDSATTTMVANVTTTIASTTAMTPGVWLGYTTASIAKAFESTYLRLWTLESLHR